MMRFHCRLTRPWKILLTIAFVLFVALTYVFASFPAVESYDERFERFWNGQSSSHKSATYPVEIFGNVMAIPCHSHNDYWRRRPLFSALGSGCISIEADVWLQDGDLFVGHTRHSLRDNSTLRTLYIDPLTDIMKAVNSLQLSGLEPASTGPLGVFYNDPAQTLTLLVDFKTPGADAWPVLLEQLRPLRDAGWLTHWNGTARIGRPLIVVASGSVGFDVIVANHTYRDVFYDAPLDALEDSTDWQADDGKGVVRYFKYNPSNSHFASARLAKAIGPLFFSKLSVDQLNTIHRQILNARERQLIPRYWGTPRWPRGLRDAIWACLVQEEAGLLNVDDLRAMRKESWGIWP